MIEGRGTENEHNKSNSSIHTDEFLNTPTAKHFNDNRLASAHDNLFSDILCGETEHTNPPRTSASWVDDEGLLCDFGGELLRCNQSFDGSGGA